jgi:lipid-A-disaccharide synthase-like uncharacterized protein
VDFARSQPDLKKIAIIQNFPTPHIATNVRAFWVLIGYYGRFVSGYAKIAEPLFAFTKKECKLFWTPICQTTFVALKMRLVEALSWLDLISTNLSSWMLIGQ